MTKRFENAVMKLYNAFHNGELNANDCTKCAVGNICDNTVNWVDLVDEFGSGIVSMHASERSYNRIKEQTGYNAWHIVTIEKIFLDTCNWKRTNDYTDKNIQFKGLCAVVECLCELDGIPNVMDYKWLFESEENKPEKVFIHEYN